MTIICRKTVRVVTCLLVVETVAWAAFVASTIAAPSDNAVKATPAQDPDDPKLAGHFSGRVTGPDGKPVHGARLFVMPISDGLDGSWAGRPSTDALAVRAKTREDGRFEFDAPDMTIPDLDDLPTRRRCMVIAAADGYGPDWVETQGRTRSTTILDPIKGTDLALQLDKDDVPIRGHLLDPDGKPLGGARVQLTGLMIPKGRDLDTHLDRQAKASMDSGFLSGGPDYERVLYQPRPFSGLITETHTDADGRFTLSGLGRDRLATLRVTAPGVVDSAVTVMTRDATDARVGYRDALAGLSPRFIYGAHFTLQLKRGRTLSGVVLDRETHQPIPGMWVGTGRENYPRDGIWYNQTVTDAKGHFNITGLDPSVAKWSLTAVSPPGMTYQSASLNVEGDAPAVIECPRGIPYHLKLVDERGQAVEAEVTYYEVLPNPYAPRVFCLPSFNPISRAARKTDGSYEGFVLPGPGAVFVQTPGRPDYLPAQVDPQAFFAAGRSVSPGSKQAWEFGSWDTVQTVRGATEQNDYPAIVLVNPAPKSPALELSATVVKRMPRRVSLVDPEGKPVVGASTKGMTSQPYDYEPPLRSAFLSLHALHPNRERHITFLENDRHLVGLLVARGDGDTPYTVRMQPWAQVTGRIVDEKSNPRTEIQIEIRPETDLGVTEWVNIDSDGLFRIEKLIPGQAYSAKIYQGNGTLARSAGMAFEKLNLRAGEVRDLGDIRSKPPVAAAPGKIR